jgi:hypothetical protein
VVGWQVEKRLQRVARDKAATAAEKSALEKLVKALDEGKAARSVSELATAGLVFPLRHYATCHCCRVLEVQMTCRRVSGTRSRAIIGTLVLCQCSLTVVSGPAAG